LKGGLDLDGHCPNVLRHRSAEGATRHPINGDQFVRLVEEQLGKNQYRGCKALGEWGKMGATAVLFKLELVPYGYTFVGKGIRSPHPWPYGHETRLLNHESCMYARLDRLQGEAVPVHLGLVQLARGYILRGSWVFHMMLMSCGGETLADPAVRDAVAGVADLAAEVRRSSQVVWAEGVDHDDERNANRVWNDETRRVMLIDFDQATLLPRPKQKRVVEVSGNRKRKKK
ncbi:hypothetical protein B0J13DRAFT_410678, partial [Dactylonectria estremocensis]